MTTYPEREMSECSVLARAWFNMLDCGVHVQHAGAADTYGRALTTWRPRIDGRGSAQGARWAPRAGTWRGGQVSRTTGTATSTACTPTPASLRLVTARDGEMQHLAAGTTGTATPPGSTSSAKLSLNRDRVCWASGWV